MAKVFELHARTVSFFTLISRVSGLARDAVLSRVFGAGPVMDAFFFAFMVPNLFRRLFGEGALSAAFLPVYTRLDRDEPETARQLASYVVGRATIALGLIVLACELLLLFVRPQDEHAALAVRLARIMLPYMPLVCLVALFGSMLQVHHTFGPTAAAPIVLNLGMIGGAFLATRLPDIGIAFVALAVVAAGLVQVGWSLLALRRLDWWRRETSAARSHVRTVLAQAMPMLVGLGVLQLNTFLDGVIASYPTTFGSTIFGLAYPLDQGAMATVSYAQRLYQFPLGVFGIAVATAIFPQLSREADDDRLFLGTVRRGLRLVVFIGLPASAGLILVRGPLVRVVLEGGRFTEENTSAVGTVLLGYAAAVWAYSMVHVLTRAFYARGQARRPMNVAVAIVILNLALNLTLIWPLGVAGLAWATAITSTLQAIVLTIMLGRDGERLLDHDVLGSWARTAAATIVMAASILLLKLLPLEVDGWAGGLLELATLVTGGLAVFFGGALLLGMQELRWLARR